MILHFNYFQKSCFEIKVLEITKLFFFYYLTQLYNDQYPALRSLPLMRNFNVFCI
jgi:hypothetical protein